MRDTTTRQRPGAIRSKENVPWSVPATRAIGCPEANASTRAPASGRWSAVTIVPAIAPVSWARSGVAYTVRQEVTTLAARREYRDATKPDGENGSSDRMREPGIG